MLAGCRQYRSLDASWLRAGRRIPSGVLAWEVTPGTDGCLAMERVGWSLHLDPPLLIWVKMRLRYYEQEGMAILQPRINSSASWGGVDVES